MGQMFIPQNEMTENTKILFQVSMVLRQPTRYAFWRARIPACARLPEGQAGRLLFGGLQNTITK